MIYLAPLECGNNEIFEYCPKPCFDDKCRSHKHQSKCEYAIEECDPRCICRHGFLRDESGDCIPAGQCFRSK